MESKGEEGGAGAGGGFPEEKPLGAVRKLGMVIPGEVVPGAGVGFAPVPVPAPLAPGCAPLFPVPPEGAALLELPDFAGELPLPPLAPPGEVPEPEEEPKDELAPSEGGEASVGSKASTLSAQAAHAMKISIVCRQKIIRVLG